LFVKEAKYLYSSKLRPLVVKLLCFDKLLFKCLFNQAKETLKIVHFEKNKKKHILVLFVQECNDLPGQHFFDLLGNKANDVFSLKTRFKSHFCSMTL